MADLAFRAHPSPEHERSHMPDTPIAHSIPYKSRQRGTPRHFRFLPYFAKKPWQVVQEYIKYYTAPGDLVCDPFSGSGVVAVESLVIGRRAVANDINPVALFLARMTAVSPVDLEKLRQAYEFARSLAQEPVQRLWQMGDAEIANLLQQLNYPRVPIPTGVRRAGADTVDQLHTPRQLAGLTILRDAIKQVSEPALRDLLYVALANTVRYANKTYNLPMEPNTRRRAPYTGDANIFRRFSYSFANQFYELEVWPSFERSFNNVLEAKEETNRLIGERYNEENFVLSQVPAWHIHEITGEGTVDYCFTDPPYSNDIRFLGLSTLWAAWLGLEITDELYSQEMLIDKKQGKSREKFVSNFTSSMESIARCLKQDRWFTLVYKNRDLSLWQDIIAACESSGLQYVNAVWQNLSFRSTRQIESPKLNPSGDMYLNFRKMSARTFSSIYRTATVLELPTRPNYIEHEVERIIVAYLGADIELITASVIQQILDSRAFRTYRGNPAGLRDDIQSVLQQPRFATWQPQNGINHWIIAPNVVLDPTLPTIDRVRYHIFEFLRTQYEATEGEISQYLFSRLADERKGEAARYDVRALLRNVAREVEPHVWQFDAARVADYKQLRLLFWPSKVDELREQIEERFAEREHRPLRPNLEGIALLRDRLREANTANKHFDKHYNRLLDVLDTVLWRLKDRFEEQIELVLAVDEWATDGIDLRNLSYEEIVIEIVLRSAERSFALYRRLAEEVFTDLHDDDIRVQFRLATLSEWKTARLFAESKVDQESLGIPLLTRV